MKIQHKREKQNYLSLLQRYRNKVRILQCQLSKLTQSASNEPGITKVKDRKQIFDSLVSNEIAQKFSTTKSRKEKRIITSLIDKNKFKESKVSTDLRKVCLRERFKKHAINLNINVQQSVENFYEEDINSRLTPGKKQYKKKHGIVKQKRYLLNSMKNLHRRFLAEYPNIKISYTTFTRHRPFWISLPVDDRDTCACTLHTNFNLLIAALNKNNIINVKDCQELIQEICCDKYNIDCLSRKCTTCEVKKVQIKEFRMHFGGSCGQVCLHTAVVYLKTGLRATQAYSICTASECTRHDAAAVWAHLDYLIKFVYDKSPQINRIHILTDGPTSQYRNKYIFYILTQLKNDFPQLSLVTWNYQEAGHGKGAPDGIGAVIKRTADYQVRCQQDVGTFDTFVDVIRKNVKNVDIGIIDEDEIKMKVLLLPKNIATFKGTMSVHQVVWTSDSEYLEFRKQSCFECLNTACEHGKHTSFSKMYNTPTEPTVHNMNIVPENKRVTVLSDITFNYGNVSTPHGIASQTMTTSLRSVRHSWTNKSFIKNQTKATGHEKEFLKFIGKSKNEDESSSD